MPVAPALPASTAGLLVGSGLVSGTFSIDADASSLKAGRAMN
jgi:hypothetical protein